MLKRKYGDTIVFSIMLALAQACWTVRADSLTLSMQDAVHLALRANPYIRIAHLQNALDKFALTTAKQQFKPEFSLEGLAQYQNQQSPLYMVHPAVTWATPIGTRMRLSQTNTFLSRPEKSVSFTLTQPLWRGARPAVVLSALQDAKDDWKISQLTLAATVTAQINQVLSTYRQLLREKLALSVQRQATRAAKKQLQADQLRFQAGQISKLTLLARASQFQSQQLAIEEATFQLQANQQHLLLLLGLPALTPIDIINDIPTMQYHLAPLNTVIRLALKNNLDYKRTLISLKQRQRALLRAQDAQRWDITLNGFITRENADVSDHRQNHGVNLSVKIPFEKHSVKAQLLASRLALQKARFELTQQKARIIAEATQLLGALKTQKKQIQLAKQQVSIAKSLVEATTLGQQYGRVSAYDAVRQEENLTRAQINLIERKIQLANTIDRLHTFLGQTLTTWGVTLHAS